MVWFKALRKNVLHVSVQDLAQELGVAPSTLCRWEAGFLGGLKKDAFLHLQDYVHQLTRIDLPAAWYFAPPTEAQILGHFEAYLSGDQKDHHSTPSESAA